MMTHQPVNGTTWKGSSELSILGRLAHITFLLKRGKYRKLSRTAGVKVDIHYEKNPGQTCDCGYLFRAGSLCLGEFPMVQLARCDSAGRTPTFLSANRIILLSGIVD